MKIINSTKHSIQTLINLTWRYVGHQFTHDGTEMDIFSAYGTNIYCILYADGSREYLEA